MERLRGITAHGTPAVVVAVYGNRAYEDALLELCDAAAERGFRVIAAGAFIARHSIVPDIAAGRPDSADFAALERFAAAVREKLAAAPAAEALSAVTPPGSRPYREFGGVPMHPSAPKVKVRPVRQVRGRVPHGGHRPRRAGKDGRRQVHHLHALRGSMPALRPHGEHRPARRHEGAAEKGLPRPPRARNFPVNSLPGLDILQQKLYYCFIFFEEA